MKLKVVGWVYPFYNFEVGEATWSVRNAIIDEIRKHGYEFSGRSHQDGACTPVLNNGKKYLFSSEGWGDIMAEAHGDTGCMDYLKYDFPIAPWVEKLPDWDDNEFNTALYSDEYDFEQDFEEWFEEWFEGFVDQSEETKKILREEYRNQQEWLVPETDLNEQFEIEVSKEVFDCAESERKVKLNITPELRYLDAGDTLRLNFQGMTKEFTVLDVERKRNLTAKKRSQLQHDMTDFKDKEKARRAKEEIDRTKMILVVKLEKPAAE